MLYAGYANSYSFKHNGKSLILEPLALSEPHKAKTGIVRKAPIGGKLEKTVTFVRESLESP